MKKFMVLFYFLVSVVTMNATAANYNNNMSGIITSILAYPNGTVFIVLNNQPKSHPKCDHSFFELDINSGKAGFDRMYSRFLTSYAKGESVNIGFDDGTSADSACGHLGRIPILRAG